MLPDPENVVDYVPSFYYLISLIPVVIVIASPASVVAVNSMNDLSITNTSLQVSASNHLLVYRVHQIDLPYGRFGCRNSIFNLEALTPEQVPDFFIRKCALFRWKDLLKQDNYLIFNKKILQDSVVSAVVIILEDLNFKTLSDEEIRRWHSIEKKLLTNSTNLPIYLMEQNEQINQLYDDLQNSVQINHSKTSSFKNMIAQNLFKDTYQLVVNGPQSSPISNPVVTSFQTKLIGAGLEDQIPTYVIVTHYDSYSIIPSLSYGTDSNASGLIIFMELLRIFSKLYSSVRTRPKANLVFFLSGGGKLDYFGTKKWLDGNLESVKGSDLLFENMQFALCLESLADAMNGNGLFMYVSKPPKPGTGAASYLNHLQDISKNYYPSINTTMIHKKINLAEDYLYWEHERFSMKRLSAFTLTSLPTSSIIKRRTLIDFPNEQILYNIETYINIIGEALARQLYGKMNENLFNGEYAISRPYLKSLFKKVTETPRSQNLLLTNLNGNHNSNQYQLSPLLKMLHMMLRKYSDNQVRLFHHRVDQKNPEFVFYEPVQTKLFIYKTKPAIFDLFITILVIIYLVLFFAIVKYYNYLIILFRIFNINERGSFVKIKSK